MKILEPIIYRSVTSRIRFLKGMGRGLKITLLSVSGFCLFVLPCLGQKTLTIRNAGAAPILYEQFRNLGSEEKSVRFDGLFGELSKRPNSTAVIFLFCGKVCEYGEIEAHLRGIEAKLYFRGFDRSRVTIANGGYRELFELEMWIVPPDASPPLPKATINIKDVTFRRLRRTLVEPYDCCDGPTGMWNEFRKNSKKP